MAKPGRPTPEFRDKPPQEYKRPDLNPYLVAHRTMGPPVLTVTEAQDHWGEWERAFDRVAPLQVEVGSGNGFYLAGMASQVPEDNWLGIEIRFKRVVMVATKIRRAGISNARIARYDAWHLYDLFAPGEVAGLHVNHPDPWEKDRQAKKRLLGPEFAAWMNHALAVGARARFKSDHRPNLERMLDAVQRYSFDAVLPITELHEGDVPWEPDVVTNYQSKFYKKGEPVYALELCRRG